MTRLEQWDIVTGIGMTALTIAVGRALETHRPDGLVRDPYAGAFIDAARPPVPIPRRPEDLGTGPWEDDYVWRLASAYVGVRSRFFDDYLTRAAREGIGQVVLLAAGLDSRAFRLDWPAGCELFEIDQPEVLDFKNAVLDAQRARPRCDRRTVAVDLREDWPPALREAGFDPGRPTAWLAEGLLPYLPPQAEQSLFDHLHELSAPGSRSAVEYLRQDAEFDSAELRRLGDRAGADYATLWHIGDRPAPDHVLTARGWTVRTHKPTDAAREYGRELDDRMTRHAGNHAYLTARR